MSEAELTRIKNEIDTLKENYASNKESIYYKILENISDTCIIKMYLLEINNLNCISGGEPIFDQEEKILKLLLITSDDEQLLDEGFKGEHAILQYLTNVTFIKALFENSGEAKEADCVGGGRRQRADWDGTSKTKMRSHRSKKRSKKSSKKRLKKRSKRKIR